jgi:hypothetical protein
MVMLILTLVPRMIVGGVMSQIQFEIEM